MEKRISESFENVFSSQSLGRQTSFCDKSPLASTFLRVFRSHQPVLEAGCGSGRWNGWFAKNGIASDGLDWSVGLCSRAQRELVSCRFLVCDLNSIPVAPESYLGIISLGAIEHTASGPSRILSEFRRILRPGGVLRRLRRLFRDRPILFIKNFGPLRKVLRKETAQPTLAEAHAGVNSKWWPIFVRRDEGWHFWEYEFSKRQLRGFLRKAGFKISEESVIDKASGIHHTFGPRFVRWHAANEEFSYSAVGETLSKIIPSSLVGHMLCYVVVKAED